jgi:hypothetical protein
LLYGRVRPNRPLVARRNRVSTEELFADIAERAASVHAGQPVSARQ